MKYAKQNKTDRDKKNQTIGTALKRARMVNLAAKTPREVLRSYVQRDKKNHAQRIKGRYDNHQIEYQ